MSKDYYQILGVEKKASKEEIKKAFRKLAHEHHPDKQGGDESKFKEANEAYSVLSDEKKRAEYDAYGRVFSGAGNGGPSGGGFGGFNPEDFQGFNQGVEFDFGDIFSGFGDIFGGGRAKRGRDISIDLELEFKESIFGTERKVLLTKPSVCETCNGDGGEPGTEKKQCETCGGQGKVHETKKSFIGTFATVSSCKTCHGRGSIPEKECNKCKGEGIVREQSEISVKVPAGIENGEMIRLTGMGEAITSGSPGDLYVKIHVKKHKTFQKEGADLVMSVPVKLSDALLGSKYTIETLEGPLEITIPELVSPGQTLRVRDKGVPTGKGRGDLLIKLKINLPERLSRKTKKLIEGLREEGI